MNIVEESQTLKFVSIAVRKACSVVKSENKTKHFDWQRF